MLLNIATLDCDIPVPSVLAERGFYSDIFEKLLRESVDRLPLIAQSDVQFLKYDCVQGEVPSDEDLQDITAILITGSSCSAYDDFTWIHNLIQFVKDVYTSRPNIKIFGSCFGHQLICHVLFSTQERKVVSRDPKGWELGVHPISLTQDFLAHFGPVTTNPTAPSKLRLQFIHADHVVLPCLPEGFVSVGRSEHCALQGVWQKGRILTYQGHAEFDRFINSETLKVFGALWDDDVQSAALGLIDGVDDATWAAGTVLNFFLGDEQSYFAIEGNNRIASEVQELQQATVAY